MQLASKLSGMVQEQQALLEHSSQVQCSAPAAGLTLSSLLTSCRNPPFKSCGLLQQTEAMEASAHASVLPK